VTGLTDFDSRATGWDADPAKVDRARRVAAAIVREVPDLSRRSVLEYGAGTGLLGFALAPHAASVTLADVSAGMLDEARRKIGDGGASNVHTLPLDLVHDPAPPARHGVVCTLMTLHHVPDVDRVLERFHGMLEPGGFLFVSDLDREDGSFHGPGFDGHHGFDRDDLAGRIARAGFGPARFSTAFTVRKMAGGVERMYPAFLAVARRA
jgi:2-polyprenyl-3-methyl-5-hydroxy-6-metoxy-1,4-benzoquinol methylase